MNKHLGGPSRKRLYELGSIGTSLRRPGPLRAVWPCCALPQQPLLGRSSRAAWMVSAAIGVGQLNQKLFRRDEIGGAETFRKAVADRRDAGDGLGRPALTP
jgi:hypothetical protein